MMRTPAWLLLIAILLFSGGAVPSLRTKIKINSICVADKMCQAKAQKSVTSQFYLASSMNNKIPFSLII